MGWREVVELILDDIQARGIGAELDADAQIAERAGCSVPTVKHAMAELVRRGFVDRRKGKKTVSLERGTIISGSDFSFRQSAREHGSEVITNLLEKSRRAPSRNTPGDVEMRAHKALGLKRNEPFFVVSRLRTLDGSPRVIHCSYLNPSHYPTNFLAKHDFESESLLEVLEIYGLRMHSRETRIRAALPTPSERELLTIQNEPVLRVEQTLRASKVETGNLITSEYLYAVYSNWEYIINDRR